MIVVSDTSPISNLFLVGQLHLLNALYGEIILPEIVRQELDALANFGFDVGKIRAQLPFREQRHQNIVLFEHLSEDLDPGESSAITLAKELNADLLLMDERTGTRTARELGLKTIGVLGILAEAKDRGMLSEISPILLDLRLRAGFWLSREVERKYLESVGEQ